MIKFKFNVSEALENAGMSSYKAKETGILSQDTWRKIKEGNANISMKSLNNVCAILNMQPEHIIMYVQSCSDKKAIDKFKDMA